MAQAVSSARLRSQLRAVWTRFLAERHFTRTEPQSHTKASLYFPRSNICSAASARYVNRRNPDASFIASCTKPGGINNEPKTPCFLSSWPRSEAATFAVARRVARTSFSLGAAAPRAQWAVRADRCTIAVFVRRSFVRTEAERLMFPSERQALFT